MGAVRPPPALPRGKMFPRGRCLASDTLRCSDRLFPFWTSSSAFSWGPSWVLSPWRAHLEALPSAQPT